jgi:DeoR family transcriptional regulator, aga operon transcriptional repressor
VDRVFLGLNGIDAQNGLTSGNCGEAAVNQVMVQQARQRIAVADHSKLGVTATYRFCAAKDIHLLITDTGATDAAIAPFQELGVEVKRV